MGPVQRLSRKRVGPKRVRSAEQATVWLDDIVWSPGKARRGWAESAHPQHKRDELEKAMAGTESSGATDSGVTARVFGTFLTWLNEKTSPVFVIATCNDISMLPPELLRKGRLDELFFLDLPSAASRKEIFKIHVRKRGRDPDKYDFSELVTATKDYSGSEIEQVVISSMFDAFEDGAREFNEADMLKSAKEMVPLSVTMKDRLDWLRGWAETRARSAHGDTDNGNDRGERWD